MVQLGNHTGFRRYWIFQAVPDRFDFDKYLEPGRSDIWELNQYRDAVAPGDIVYLWRSGRAAGLWGWGQITDSPLVSNGDKGSQPDVSVPVEYRVRLRDPLMKDEVGSQNLQGGALSGLLILRAPRGTNFKVTTYEAITLNETLRSRGEEAPPDPVGTATSIFPAASLLPLTFGGSTTRIFGATLRFDSEAPDGSRLFEAMAALSVSVFAPPRGIVDMLRRFGKLEFYPQQTTDFIDEPVQLASGVLADLTIRSDLLEIAEAARLLAIHTTGREEISLRHLLGGLLLAGSPKTLSYFWSVGKDLAWGPETFINDFVDFLRRGFPRDDHSAWLETWRPAVERRSEDFRSTGFTEAPVKTEELATPDRDNTIDSLEAARAIEKAELRAQALSELAPHLPVDLRKGVVEEVLSAIREVTDTELRAEVNAKLAPQLGVPPLEGGPTESVRRSATPLEEEQGREQPPEPRFEFAQVFAGRQVSDRPSGADLLSIEAEVKALAHLFALRDPNEGKSKDDRNTFALGLFGRWGAGKSFFIDKMRHQIAAFAQQAQNGGAPYCKNIVQIDFNAWHYNESNVWASLVHHIFNELKNNLEEAQFKRLIGELEISQQQRKEIQDKLEVKQVERAAINEAIAKARESLESNVGKQMETIGLLPHAMANEKVRSQLTALLGGSSEILGLSEKTSKQICDSVGAPAQELLTTLQESGALVATMQSTSQTLLHSVLSPWFIGALGSALMVYIGAPHLFENENLWSDLLPEIGQGLAVATAVLAWIKVKLGKAKKVMNQLAGIETTLREQIAEEEEKRNETLRTLRPLQERLKADIDRDEELLATVNEDIREIEAELDELGSPESLVDFINNRATSDDYRSKLGILAMIRSDFEKLSDLITGRGASYATGGSSSEAGTERDRGETTVAQGNNGNDPQTEKPELDRIILFIDDLDRVQESGKVLQVLEAVHLLLAFPLFHVVVAVDERWAARSVLQHHKAFFGLSQRDEYGADDEEETDEGVGKSSARGSRSGSPGGSNGATRLELDEPLLAALGEPIAGEKTATPREFLEKIFQICFWVRPLSRQLTNELIAGTVNSKAAVQSDGNADMPPDDTEQAIADLVLGEVAANATSQPTEPLTKQGGIAPISTPGATSSTTATIVSPDNKVGQAGHTMVGDDTFGSARPRSDDTLDGDGIAANGGTDSAANGSGDAAVGNGDESAQNPISNPSFDGVSGDRTAGQVGVLGGTAHCRTKWQLSAVELDTIRSLSPVLGKSPRAATRLCNTYCLLKAKKLPAGSGADVLAPYEPEEIADRHAPIMTLMALQIGYPSIATHILGRFDEARLSAGAHTVSSVLNNSPTLAPDVDRNRWDAACAAIDAVRPPESLEGESGPGPAMKDLDIADLHEWQPAVEAMFAVIVAISQAELITMQGLGRVVGRSPRTVKRFIQTYGLFKAMCIPPGTGDGLTKPYRSGDIAASHVPIMFLLAIQIGHPDVAYHMFEALDEQLEAVRGTEKNPRVSETIKTLKGDPLSEKDAIEQGIDQKKWTRALSALEGAVGEDSKVTALKDMKIGELDDWLLGTSRFGFKEWVPKAERLWG